MNQRPKAPNFDNFNDEPKKSDKKGFFKKKQKSKDGFFVDPNNIDNSLDNNLDDKENKLEPEELTNNKNNNLEENEDLNNNLDDNLEENEDLNNNLEDKNAQQKTNQPNKPKNNSKKKSLISQMRFIPALITLAVIVAMSLVYFGVRGITVDDFTNNYKQVSDGYSEKLNANFKYPDNWSAKRQSNVANSDYRLAINPPNTRAEGFFIIKYSLNKEPKNDKDLENLDKEIKSSLQKTGANKNIKSDNEEVNGYKSLQYEFDYNNKQGNKYQANIVYLLDKKEMYQLSCQSRRGKRGDQTRKDCETILDSFEIKD